MVRRYVPVRCLHADARQRFAGTSGPHWACTICLKVPPQCASNIGRPVLLGCHAFQARVSSTRFLGHWSVLRFRIHNLFSSSLGWFNLLGQVAVTTGISFGCATFISTVATLNTNFVPNEKTQIGVYAAVLVSQGLINTFGVHLLHYLNDISVWWHALGTVSLVIAILAKAPKLQSAEFVFQTFIDGTGGWAERASPAYVVVIGVRACRFQISSRY